MWPTASVPLVDAFQRHATGRYVCYMLIPNPVDGIYMCNILHWSTHDKLILTGLSSALYFYLPATFRFIMLRI
jgi:3-methyladenine DNA glycosylase AlkC